MGAYDTALKLLRYWIAFKGFLTMSSTLPYGGGMDNTFGCYSTNYVWGVLCLMEALWTFKTGRDRYFGAFFACIGASAFVCGLCHQFYYDISTTEFTVTWFIGTFLAVTASWILAWRAHRLFGMISILALGTGFLLVDEPGLVNLAGCLQFNLVLIGIGFEARNRMMIFASIWCRLLHAVWLGWWRPSCAPTGRVPETWPEDAIFSWKFNHNAWYHVGFMVFTVLLAMSLKPRAQPGAKESRKSMSWTLVKKES